MSCIVYCATKMTNRDRVEMLERAHYVCDVLTGWGLTPISPVLEEKVTSAPGPLVQTSEEQLRAFWKRDKDIIAYEAHVILCDEAQHKSYGVEREYGFARYCLWKPVITVVPAGTGFIVSNFEDDVVASNVTDAAILIQRNWGTPLKRFVWRTQMLFKTLPKWIYRQIRQWR